jgi:WD40 repeat protein
MIRENPLRVYHEFAFAPRSSIFHQIYSKMESFPHPIVRMGVDEDWPSTFTIQTHFIETYRLSPSEDLLAMGGSRERVAVYSVWDIRNADGGTAIHPCKTYACEVTHVSFDQRGDEMRLRTGCRCGKLFIWDISSNPHYLLDERHLGATGAFVWWADDGSKVVSATRTGSSLHCGPYQLSIVGIPHVRHILTTGESAMVSWEFAPVLGDKALGIRRHTLIVWECVSGRELFQIRCDFNYGACFSPDGTLIACYGRNSPVKVISAEDGTVIHKWDVPTEVYGLLFFPKGDKLIAYGKGFVYLLDEEIRHEGWMRHLSFSVSPHGQRIAVISEGGVDIFDHIFEGKSERHGFRLSSLDGYAFSWIHSILISKSHDSISFHYLSNNAQIHISSHELSDAKELLLSPDSHHLLTLHENSSVYLWNVSSGRHLNTVINDLTSLGWILGMEYASDSSCILLWGSDGLMVLQISAYPIESTLVLSYSRPGLIIATFFPVSNRIIMIDAGANMSSLSLPDMSQHPLPPVRSQLKDIRQLIISPSEQLMAICSEEGLSIQGINQNLTDSTLFSSNNVQSAAFSPEGSCVYMIEVDRDTKATEGGTWVISCIDILSLTVSQIYKSSFSSISPAPRLLDIIKTDSFSALRLVPWYFVRQDDFIDLSTNRKVIPPILHLKNDRLLYGDRRLMTVPQWEAKVRSISQDVFAYICKGKVTIIDYSPLITHM